MIKLSLYQAIELFNLQHGLYDPLKGFMSKEELERVIDYDFPMPIILSVDEKTFKEVEGREELFFGETKVGEIEIEEKEILDVEEYGLRLYKSKEHPGYKLFVKNHSKFIISGKVDEKERISLKEEFKKKGWKSIAGFQTRNIPHIGHERVQKHALEIADGLLLSPVLGIKNKGDFKNEVIEEVYREYYKEVYKGGEAKLEFIFLNMRYLGGREAAFHAIVRKNLGCTHFIVGRDHAGVSGYYKPYQAQEEVMSLDLGIEIIPVKEVLYCENCKKAVFEKDCEHEKRNISGTKIRESITVGKPEETYLRKSVANALKRFEKPFVEEGKDEEYLKKKLLERWKNE